MVERDLTMSEFVKSTIWQGIIFAVVVQILIFAMNYHWVLSMLSSREEEDFSYHDTYFVVYHGIFEDSPKLTLFLLVSITLLLSIILFGIAKWEWLRFI